MRDTQNAPHTLKYTNSCHILINLPTSRNNLQALKEHILFAKPRFNRHYFCHLLACFMFALLSACGGGGGGNPAPDNTGGTNPVVDSGGGGGTGDGGIGSSSGGDSGADGSAGDGAPIVGGLVTITDANGLSVTATTNLQGYYSVNISNFKSPLIGSVTKANRTLFTFSTKVAATNKTVTINITGITDKIVSDIAGLAGKDSARKITAADIVANANNIAGVIAAVNSSIASILTANGLNPATFDPINTPFLTNHKGYDAVLDALQITNSPTSPTVIVPLTPIQATQQLFKSLRDTAGAYSNTANTGELDTAGNTLEAAINNGTTFADRGTLLVIGKFPVAAKMYHDFKSGVSTRAHMSPAASAFGRRATISSTGSPFSNSLFNEYVCELATVTTNTTETDILTYAIANSASLPANVNAFACYGVGLPGGMFGDALDDNRFHWHSIIYLPQTDGSFKYVHQTRCAYFDQRISTSSSRVGPVKTGIVSGTKDANNNYTSFNMQGQITPGFEMLKVRTFAERNKFSHHTLNLKFSDVVTGNAKTTLLEGSISLVKVDGTSASEMIIAPGSILSSKTDLVRNNGTAFTYNQATCPTGLGKSQFGLAPNLTCTSIITSTFSELSAMNLDVSVSMTNAKFEGTLSAGSATKDVTTQDTSYQPTDVVFNGKLYEGDGLGGYRLFLNGKIEVINTNYSLIDNRYTNASNYPKRNVKFDGKLLLKNRPEMSLVLDYRNSSYTASSMTGNFTWDGGWGFNIASNNDTANNTGAITFTSVSGVTFTLPKNSGSIKQPIYKNGALMGDFTLNSKRIDYTDGSFEQF
jgi:hypothetical protein